MLHHRIATERGPNDANKRALKINRKAYLAYWHEKEPQQLPTKGEKEGTPPKKRAIINGAQHIPSTKKQRTPLTKEQVPKAEHGAKRQAIPQEPSPQFATNITQPHRLSASAVPANNSMLDSTPCLLKMPSLRTVVVVLLLRKT